MNFKRKKITLIFILLFISIFILSAKERKKTPSNVASGMDLYFKYNQEYCDKVYNFIKTKSPLISEKSEKQFLFDYTILLVDVYNPMNYYNLSQVDNFYIKNNSKINIELFENAEKGFGNGKFHEIFYIFVQFSIKFAIIRNDNDFLHYLITKPYIEKVDLAILEGLDSSIDNDYVLDILSLLVKYKKDEVFKKLYKFQKSYFLPQIIQLRNKGVFDNEINFEYDSKQI